jgi:acetyl-CoA decarbonylase/synthase complex subunit gamma
MELFDLRSKSAATDAGSVPVVSATWSRQDRLGRLKCRLFNSVRMNYTVQPGIYAVGSPNAQSPVLVTANYKLSFDLVRRELDGIDAWILVLDTRGINVWCAAGKGTFGTAELIRRIQSTRLNDVVEHRRIILPQLGAPGVQAHLVKEQTGFRVSYGPVYARDIPTYLESGFKATEKMRRVEFRFKDRLELTPMEIVPALTGFLVFLAAVFVVFGLKPTGILFRSAAMGGLPVAILGAAALLSGTFLTPLLLPWIPLRSFALKGFVVGGVIIGLLVFLPRVEALESNYLTAFSLVFFPAASSFLALQFTGSTTFTSISGVKRELKVALPLYTAAGAVSLVLLILYKLQEWGIL